MGAVENRIATDTYQSLLKAELRRFGWDETVLRILRANGSKPGLRYDNPYGIDKKFIVPEGLMDFVSQIAELPMESFELRKAKLMLDSVSLIFGQQVESSDEHVPVYPPHLSVTFDIEKRIAEAVHPLRLQKGPKYLVTNPLVRMLAQLPSIAVRTRLASPFSTEVTK
jgi:hypothetical protein